MPKDVDFFKNEKGAIISLIEEQQEELVILQENQQSRMSEKSQAEGLPKNKEVYKRLNDIVFFNWSRWPVSGPWTKKRVRPHWRIDERR